MLWNIAPYLIHIFIWTRSSWDYTYHISVSNSSYSLNFMFSLLRTLHLVIHLLSIIKVILKLLKFILLPFTSFSFFIFQSFIFNRLVSYVFLYFGNLLLLHRFLYAKEIVIYFWFQLIVNCCTYLFNLHLLSRIWFYFASILLHLLHFG